MNEERLARVKREIAANEEVLPNCSEGAAVHVRSALARLYSEKEWLENDGFWFVFFFTTKFI